MAQLHHLLFHHVAPVQAEVAPLPEGGALFSTEGFDRFLKGSPVAPGTPAQAERQGRSPFPSPPDWGELRPAWAKVLPLESTSYEGWLASLQAYANLDWSALQTLDIDL